MLNKQIFLEINKPLLTPLISVQYDYNARFYDITIINQGEPLDLTGLRVVIAGEKSDGNVIFNSCEIIDAMNGKIRLEITEQMSAVVGVTKYALELFSENGMLSSQPFQLKITKSTISRSISSSSELSALQDALNEVQNIDNRFTETNAQLLQLANKGTTVEVIERATKEEIERQIADGTIANLTIDDNSITPDKTTFFDHIANHINFNNADYIFRFQEQQSKITLIKENSKLTYSSTNLDTTFFAVKLNLTVGTNYTINFSFFNSNSNGFDICTDAELGNSILAVRENTGAVEFTATSSVMYFRLFIRPNETAILECRINKKDEKETIKSEFLPPLISLFEDGSILPEKTSFFTVPKDFINFIGGKYLFRGDGSSVTLIKKDNELTYSNTAPSTVFFGVELGGLTVGTNYTINFSFFNSNSNGFDICTDAELGNSILAVRENTGAVEFTATSSVMYFRLFIRANETAMLQCNIFKKGEEKAQIKAEYLPSIDVNSELYSWKNSIWTAYGDSITAISNGNGIHLGWAKYINDFFGFSDFFGRGVGGQTFTWNNVTFYANPDGTYHSRDSAHNPPSGTTEHKGCFCSWDRIKAMYPENIRHKIKLVFIMGGTNDLANAEESTGKGMIVYNKPIWSKEFKTDTDWLNDSQYYLGGDYDVNTFSGAIASTIMKFQVWCPNALIVIGTPLSRWYTPTFYPSSQSSNDTYINGMANGVDTNDLSDVVVKVSNYMAIPCIDVNRTCGINGFNWDKYMDGVHPYPEKGKKMLARTIISGLKNISPLID